MGPSSNRAALAGTLLGVATFAVYMIGSNRSFGYDAAASFAKGQVVTPGSLVSIFGSDLASGLSQAGTIPLSNSLGGVSVKFNDIPAPLVFVSPTQINAQLPWGVLPPGTSSGTVSVVVTRGSASSAAKTVQVGPFSPGIFSVQFGVGQAE